MGGANAYANLRAGADHSSIPACDDFFHIAQGDGLAALVFRQKQNKPPVPMPREFMPEPDDESDSPYAQPDPPTRHVKY